MATPSNRRWLSRLDALLMRAICIIVGACALDAAVSGQYAFAALFVGLLIWQLLIEAGKQR